MANHRLRENIYLDPQYIKNLQLSNKTTAKFQKAGEYLNTFFTTGDSQTANKHMKMQLPLLVISEMHPLQGQEATAL